jgi:inosose dehydratase
VTRAIRDRIAGAPASWGICELPGWGYQLPAERVLSEMRELGLRATELGPPEFFRGEPREQASLLAAYELTAVSAFCPLVLHNRDDPPDGLARELLGRLSALEAPLMLIAAATGTTTYDERPQLDEDGWTTLVETVDRLHTLAAEYGVTACVHPHMGTMIQTDHEVMEVLERSDVPLCLDTGHLVVGGSDPIQVARAAADRIGHVHLKDVDLELARAVQHGDSAYTDAVRAGLYTTLGRGDLDLGAVVMTLERARYEGWYVPELDCMLAGEPRVDGPLAKMRDSVEALCNLAGAHA